MSMRLYSANTHTVQIFHEQTKVWQGNNEIPSTLNGSTKTMQIASLFNGAAFISLFAFYFSLILLWPTAMSGTMKFSYIYI